jgi:hypothetical protein
MNDKVIGIITRKEGKVDDALMAVSNRLLKEYGGVLVTEPSLYGEGKITSPHPNRSLANIMNIIRDYTNVGIGFAYSIENTKTALSKVLAKH